MKKVVVVEYPGSTCLSETARVYREIFGAEVSVIWHDEETFGAGAKPDLVIIPGGYSFGDYLRPGALAKLSPLSGAVSRFAEEGGPVIGIGNGFQILCEIGVLPGALLINPSMKFVNQSAHLKVENAETIFTKKLNATKPISLPVACYFGRYVTDRRTLKDLETNGRVVLRYCDKFGDVDHKNPFNGSTNSIAAITNRKGNVLGMMPHPERACEEILGSTAGRELLQIW